MKLFFAMLLCMSLSAAPSELSKGEKKVKPGRGDAAPELQLTDIFTEKPVALSSFAGKYVYIDFWATWCPPCQEAMKTLNEEAPEILKKWPDKVVLLGVSVDEKVAKAKKHCQKRGWDKITQSHAKNSDAFNFDGIPTAFLIGPDNKILWRGHPADLHLAKALAEVIGNETAKP